MTTVHPDTDCSNCGHTSDCGLHDSANPQPCDCGRCDACGGPCRTPYCPACGDEHARQVEP